LITRQYWESIITPFYFVVQALYLISVGWHGVTFWGVVWIMLFGWTEHKLMQMLLNEVEQGLTPGWTLDSFGILTASQVTSMYSPFSGSLLLLLLPG
jgi:hypothetical protein